MDLTPPAHDEIEVSLFGPGYGECVLAHLGAGEWLVVDSCVDQRSQRQPALAYLDAIGVDPGTAVVAVVASHWHTDHVRGISEVVADCVSAEFWVSEALSSSELLLMTRRFGKDRASKHNPFREFYAVAERLHVRREAGETAPPVAVAGARTLLWRRPVGDRDPGCEVLALSPSPTSVQRAWEVLADMLPAASDEVPYDLDEPTPNEAAVALLVQVGDARVLLGSDLENSADSERGWSAVLGDPTRPPGSAASFKVPHHGSANAHHDGVWSDMLSPRAWAVLTPFRRGRTPLPRPADLQRLQSLTDRVYLTAGTRRLKAAPKPRSVRLAMLQSAVRVEDEEGVAGHVRLRARSDRVNPDAWAVEFARPARHAPLPRTVRQRPAS